MSNKLSLLVNFVGAGTLTGYVRNIVGLGRSGSQSLRALNGEARRLQREMRDVGRDMRTASGNVTQLVQRERDLERALAGVNRQIDRQKRLAAIDANKAAMHRRGDDLRASGRDSVVGGIALAAPFIAATKGAMEFSSGMVDIQQKAEMTNAETDRMAASILRLSRAAHQLPENMRSGIDQLAGLGLDPRQAIQMIGPIGRLGTAYKVDLADGANAAFANVSNLKVPLRESALAMDIMAAAGKHGAFEVKDMARHFPALTAQMMGLGQKGRGAVADLSAALQIARRGAGSSDQAANNIENLLAKINAPATINAFKKNFGVDLPAALKRAYAEGKTPLEAIAELTKKATGGDLSKLGFAFEDMQAQGAVRQLILDMDLYKKIRAEIANAGGTVDKAFAQREARDAALNWTKFTVAAQAASIQLGTKFLPVATQFLGTVTMLAGKVGDWAQANPELAGTLAQVAGYLIVAKIGVGALQFAFGGLLKPLGTTIAFFRKVDGISRFTRTIGFLKSAVVGAGPIIIRTFGLMRMAALFLARGIMQAGLMMMANPIVLAITAIVLAVGGAAYLIYTHWDKIKGAFNAGVAWVKGILAAMPAWLKNIGSAMMQGLLMALNPMLLAQRLLAIARSGITAFKNFFGIKSPSRLFMEMGAHMTGGLALGIDQGARGPRRSMSRVMTDLARADAAGPATPPIMRRLQETPAMRPALAAVASPVAPTGDVTMHIYGAKGQDVEQLANIVIRKLEAKKGVHSRRTYEGDR